MITSLVLFQITIIFLLGGALFGLFSRNVRLARPMIFVPTMIGSIFTIIFSVYTIMGEPFTWTIPNTIPFVNFEILVDGIASFFLLIIGIVSFAVSLYSIGYSKEYEVKKRTSALGFLFNMFILSMVLVVVSNNAFFFL
ncbi:MAG TPA: hypothetical protein VLD38_06825, partial [Nitrosopumilaceae archaeon]|nr:hypothetical protein [Nitrosopumilaceae archaeon]